MQEPRNKSREARNENQDFSWITMESNLLFLISCLYFSPLLNSSIGVQHSTLFSVRISYLVFQISSLPHPLRLHFSLLVQDFAVIGSREEDEIG